MRKLCSIGPFPPSDRLCQWHIGMWKESPLASILWSLDFWRVYTTPGPPNSVTQKHGMLIGCLITCLLWGRTASCLSSNSVRNWWCWWLWYKQADHPSCKLLMQDFEYTDQMVWSLPYLLWQRRGKWVPQLKSFSLVRTQQISHWSFAQRDRILQIPSSCHTSSQTSQLLENCSLD